MRLVDAPGGGSSSNLLVTAKLGNLQPSLVDGHGVVRKTTQQVRHFPAQFPPFPLF